MKIHFFTKNNELLDYLDEEQDWDIFHRKYIIDIVKQVEKNIQQHQYGDEINFIVSKNLKKLPNLKNMVVFLYTPHEWHYVPDYSKQENVLIFKNYFDKTVYREHTSIHGFPLPPLSSMSMRDCPPLKERENDVYFSGQSHSRQSFFEKYMRIKDRLEKSFIDKKIKIQFNPNFYGGITPEEYDNDLINSKICLCPRGASVETFRYSECLKRGNIIISEKMPDAWYYENSPAITIGDWTNVGHYLKRLLSDKEAMQKLSNLSKNHWEKNFSEAAVARYIFEKINQKKWRNK